MIRYCDDLRALLGDSHGAILLSLETLSRWATQSAVCNSAISDLFTLSLQDTLPALLSADTHGSTERNLVIPARNCTVSPGCVQDHGCNGKFTLP